MKKIYVIMLYAAIFVLVGFVNHATAETNHFHVTCNAKHDPIVSTGNKIMFNGEIIYEYKDGFIENVIFSESYLCVCIDVNGKQIIDIYDSNGDIYLTRTLNDDIIDCDFIFPRVLLITEDENGSKLLSLDVMKNELKEMYLEVLPLSLSYSGNDTAIILNISKSGTIELSNLDLSNGNIRTIAPSIYGKIYSYNKDNIICLIDTGTSILKVSLNSDNNQIAEEIQLDQFGDGVIFYSPERDLYFYSKSSGKIQSIDSLISKKGEAFTVAGVLCTGLEPLILEQACKAFSDKYKDVKVEFCICDTYEQLISMVRGGSVDILILGNFDYKRFLDSNTLQNLKSIPQFVETVEDELYADWVFTIGMYNKKLYGVPFDIIIPTILSVDSDNAQFVYEFYSDGKWTWNDFFELSDYYIDNKLNLLNDSSIIELSILYIAISDQISYKDKIEEINEISKAYVSAYNSGIISYQVSDIQECLFNVVSCFPNLPYSSNDVMLLPPNFNVGQQIIGAELGLLSIPSSCKNVDMAADFITLYYESLNDLNSGSHYFNPSLFIYNDNSHILQQYESSDIDLNHFRLYEKAISTSVMRGFDREAENLVRQALYRYAIGEIPDSEFLATVLSIQE